MAPSGPLVAAVVRWPGPALLSWVGLVLAVAAYAQRLAGAAKGGAVKGMAGAAVGAAMGGGPWHGHGLLHWHGRWPWTCTTKPVAKLVAWQWRCLGLGLAAGPALAGTWAPSTSSAGVEWVGGIPLTTASFWRPIGGVTGEVGSSGLGRRLLAPHSGLPWPWLPAFWVPFCGDYGG